jgi:hypothetical protein
VSNVKMKLTMKTLALAAAVVAASLLSACGGGGGDDVADSSTPGQGSSGGGGGTNTGGSPGIVLTVPDPTYAPNSQELAVYNLLNEDRRRCGLGLLAQNTALDLAARMHGEYLRVNQTTGHDEDPSKPAFYGATFFERTAKAGYTGYNIENISYGANAEHSYRRLAAAPYHAMSFFYRSIRDVGLAVTPWEYGYNSLVLIVGYQSGYANYRDVATYPCEGTTGVITELDGEVPNPFPNQPGATWGQPVIVYGDWSSLRVTSASIIGPSGPVTIKAIYGDGATRDPNGRIQNGVAAVIPEPLQPNTTYTVTINGSNLGAPFSRTFSFRTGGQ